MTPDTEALLSLIRSLPPQDVEKVAYGSSLLAPSSFDQIQTCVERPLKVLYDVVMGRYYLCSEYNRDDSAFRSPWSNIYFPGIGVEKQLFTVGLGGSFIATAPSQATTPKAQADSDLEDHSVAPLSKLPAASASEISVARELTGLLPREGYIPSGPLREMEVLFNRALDRYRAAYFLNGVSSAYVWNVSHSTSSNLAAAFLLYNAVPVETGQIVWNSTHITVIGTAENIVTYHIISTVSLFVESDHEEVGMMNLGCTVSNQSLINAKKNDNHGNVAEQIALSHLRILGPFIESVENVMRNKVEHRYLAKLFEMTHSLRKDVSASDIFAESDVKTIPDNFTRDLSEAISKRHSTHVLNECWES